MKKLHNFIVFVREKWSYFIVPIFILAGLFFRIVGIEKNLSYWNDEDQVALLARHVLKDGLPLSDINKSTGLYQIGFYYLTALSFKIFGVYEITGRLPSVLAGTALILILYIIVKEILSEKKAIVVAFLVSFSQIQLAWSTQLRPYIWLEIFTSLIFYFCYKYLIKSRKLIDLHLILACVVAIISISFHGTGLINLPLILSTIIYKVVKQRAFKAFYFIVPTVLITVFIVYFSFQYFLQKLFIFDFNVIHYHHFIVKNYVWLFIGAVLGDIYLFKIRKYELLFLLNGYVAIIFCIAIFKINSQYVRYSLPAFPLLYVLFSTGIIAGVEYIFKKVNNYRTALFMNFLFVAILLCPPFLQKKILFQPQYYYSINADVRENPIVDYKIAFVKIKKLIKSPTNTIVMDAWNDRVPFYLPGQKFIFLNRYSKVSTVDPMYGEVMINTISDYENNRKKYQYGIVIIENWESLTPPEVQDHIRKTLKYDFDVVNLPYNENDKWSLSVYSWGL